MALTVANTITGVYARAMGDEYETKKTIAFDSSYVTGGMSLTASDLGLSGQVRDVRIDPKAGYVFEYDYTNSKVIVYYGDNNNVADGPLIEVPAATNLSTVTGVRVTARGRNIK